MWDKRESGMRYGNQNINFDSVSPEIPFVQSMRFPPPNSSNGQFFAEASRKRKSMDMDPGQDGVSARFLGNMGGKMGHPLQREYPLLHNVALPPPEDSPMLFNHNSEHAIPSNAESQYGAFQFYNMDNSLLTSETKGENIKKASFGSLRPFHHEERFFPVPTLREIPEHHDPNHLVCGIASQYEPSRFPSHSREHSGLIEMSLVAPRSDDEKNLGHVNNRISCNPCLYPFSMPSYTTSTLGSLNLRVVNENFHSDVGSFGQKFSKTGISKERECVQGTRLEEARDILFGKTYSTQAPAFSEGREAYDVYQYHDTEIRPESSTNNDNSSALLKLREQHGPPTSPMPVQAESSSKEGYVDRAFRGSETKLLERDEGSNTENTSHRSGEETSLSSGNNFVNRSVEPDDRLPLNVEERTQSVVGKVSPLIVEKLWDGSLQLSTSTTVSAVAFFKSGEKAQDTKWPEHVEIKGKVRLQAFEKFIQELPRSRNRALMVISLCWKPGSPEAGLAGMKEVAKGYKESQRVGFAQISPGLDLYVCPRCDTIITILAKYGFFKGMAAVEDDQDSLIGCVIWRRSHPSSNPVPKISEKKKTTLVDQQLQISPESSVPEINSPITVDNSESKQEKAPSPLISTLDSTRAVMAENKAIQSTINSSPGSGSFHMDSDSALEATPSKPYNSPLIQVQPPAAHKLESTSLGETMKRTEIPITQAEEPKKHDAGTEPVPPICPAAPQMLQGVQQQPNAQFSSVSHNFRNYSCCLPPKLGASISSNFSFIGAQLPTAQNLDSSYQPNPMQSNSKPELAQPALPGPPPLPLDVLHRIIQFSSEAHKAPIEGMSKTDTSFSSTGEPKKPSMGSEAEQKPANLYDDDDDDGDLPEFDFDSACGVPKAPASRFSGSSYQTLFPVPPFNQQVRVDGAENDSGTMPPPVTRSMDTWLTPHASVFSDRTLNTYHGPTTTLPTKYGEHNSEKKPADVLSLSQQFLDKTDKGSSSSCSFTQKSRWDDDDDDMPEWCPPDLECLDLPKPSTDTRVLPPVLRPASENAKELPLTPPSSITTFHPLQQSQSFSHGYHPGTSVRPSTANPAPVHQRPAVGLVPTDFRPPLVPHPNHSMRPSATNFGNKPQISDVSWQWKRQ